jgi:putative transcriptional regulator
MASLQGQLLIASKKLLDPNFRQSVVLLVQHSDGGAMGVVVNRPTTTTVDDAWEKITGTPCAARGMMYIGGPCEGALSVLHTVGEWSDIEVLDGLYFTASKDSIEELVESPRGEKRFFVGYAGWGPGQLENELARGDWDLVPAKEQYVLGSHLGLWEAMRKRSAGISVLAAMKIRNLPDDPSVN